MSGVDSPEILAAYNAVRSDKDETNWLLLSYASATGDRVTLTATGTGGISEMASRLGEGEAQYGYARVEYANDSESRRVKFVLVVWIGKGTRVMRKARVGFESAAVKKVIAHYSVQIDASDRADLDEQREIVPRLRRAGGADYNGGRG
ncbi:actin depolymerizing protein [Xylariaceae sp. FL0594]|nr:actin depolymerizing protein [Xylariaceae sp. FL0594]